MDGTLLDTLDDLAAATNATLAAYGFPVRTREEVRLFVGNGVEKLMERALPDGHATVAHLPDGSSADFGALLAISSRAMPPAVRIARAPIPAFPPCLPPCATPAFRSPSSPISLMPPSRRSPPPTSATDPLAVGERDGVRKKPAPDTVFEALRLLGVPADGTPPRLHR